MLRRLKVLFPENNREKKYEIRDELMDVVWTAAESIITDEKERDSILLKIERAAEAFESTSIEELIRAIEVASEDIEQELEKGKVNILTMHRAKGLTAEAVIVAATEDQCIPGRAQGNEVDDERRLLYVSLTRAKHHLFVTYCDKRTGRQSHAGRDTGSVYRSLSRFLVGCPHTPQGGREFIGRLARESS